MKNVYTLVCFFLTFTFYTNINGQNLDVVSITPYFNQSVDSTETPIKITFNTALDTTDLKHKIAVFSSFSASKRFIYKYNDTSYTILLNTNYPFFIGEKVTVILTKNLKGKNNENFNGFEWRFTINATKNKDQYFSEPVIYTDFKGFYITAVNLDYDIYPDITITDWYNDGKILNNEKSGTFNFFQNVPPSPHGVFITDVDLDYFTDMHSNSLLYSYEQKNDGYFSIDSTIEWGTIDFNFDGFPDRIFRLGLPPGDTTDYIGIRYNNGSGLYYTNEDTLIIDDNIVDFHVADFNNDGINDIVYVTNIFPTTYGVGGKNKITILFRDEFGDVINKYTLYEEELPPDYYFGYFYKINISDFNNDNFNDVQVITNSDDFIFINDKKGGLLHEMRNIIICGGADLPHGSVPCDLNGDGWQDLLSYYTIIPENFTSFYVLLNPINSTNTFWNDEVIVQEKEPATIGEFVTADFNNDGTLDIASVWNDGLHVYFNSKADGIKGTHDRQPSNFHFSQNYPNPFNSKTIIQYELPVRCNVELSIYNLLGQKVSSLVSKTQNTGFYRIEWRAANLSSGVYLVHLTAGNISKTRKSVLIR